MTGTTKLTVLRRWCLVVSCVAGLATPGQLFGQSVAEVCGDSPLEASGLEVGRWLAWTEGDASGLEMPPSVSGPIFERHSGLVELFQQIPNLQPPWGVEVRPSGVIRGRERVGSGPSVVHSSLLIQVFHPTVQQAGEASASVRVDVNTLTPLLYDGSGAMIEDSAGPIFIEPISVGDISGNALYKTGIRRCVVVLKAHKRPLWLPVSQERFLEAQIADIRRMAREANSDIGGAQSEPPAIDDEAVQAMIRQLRTTDPEAADKLERDMAAMKEELARQTREVGSEVAEANSAVAKLIAELEAELAAMSPTERARQAYVTGEMSGSSVLAKPEAEGARALVAPNPAYFDAEADPWDFQLIAVGLRNGADHPPETTIIRSVRLGLDWEAVASFLSGGRPQR